LDGVDRIAAEQCLHEPVIRDLMEDIQMHGIIYLVGLVVVVLFILSALGLR